jgi:hypothetical protein
MVASLIENLRHHSFNIELFSSFDMMEYIPNKIDITLMLWNDGELLATKIEGDRMSLYRYNKKLYVIWYTPENTIDKVGIVDAQSAQQLFKGFTV